MKNTKHISTTDLIINDDPVKSTGIKVYQNAFPHDLEKLYVTLSNLIYDYLETSYSITQLGERLKFVIRSLQNNYELLGMGFNGYRVCLQEAIDLLDKTEAPEEFKNIAKIASEATISLKKRNKAQNTIDGINKDRFFDESRIDVERKELATIMAQISDTLQSIAIQDINGQKRIERLELTSRQLLELENLPIDAEKKAALESQIKAYFNVRVACFKIIEDFARIIVSLYNQREIVPFLTDEIYRTSYHDDEYVIYRIAIAALVSLPDNYTLGSIGGKPLANISSDALAMEFIAKYLNTDEFDASLFDGAYGCSSELSYVLKLLSNEIERRSSSSRN